MDTRDILNLLRTELGLSNDAQLRAVDSGDINAVFHLVDGTQEYAVKWLGDDQFSGVDRFHQFVLQQQLTVKGVAPNAVWLNDDETLWVENWERSDASIQHAIAPKDLADVLWHIHGLPITGRPLNLIGRWEHYLKILSLPAGNALLEAVTALRARVVASEQKQDDIVLCHNDLQTGHVLKLNPPMVIDWEYAAMGNRYFDIASCAMINEFDDMQTMALCEAYADKSGIAINIVIEETKRHCEIVKLTNELWFAALESTGG